MAVTDQLSALLPALAFLLLGVPLAVLLGRLGFFDAVTSAISAGGREIPVWILWALAAITTVVLNLDTTIVLLTPLYLRLAKEREIDPVAVAVIPLLLASLASSVLPISNLTTLIAAERLHLAVTDVVTHLALPGLVATVVAWAVYRRRFPTRLPAAPANARAQPIDRRALRIGSVIVGALLVGFVAGPGIGVAPWITVAVADVALVVITRVIPWRSVPVLTALGVAAMAVVAAEVVPSDWVSSTIDRSHPVAVGAITLAASVVANVINNIPAVLLAVSGPHHITWGGWAWLLGVNAGAVLLPVGALANLLWRRIAIDAGVAISFRRYVSITLPVAVPAVLAAATVLGLERWLAGA